MTISAQRLAIAQACGWFNLHTSATGDLIGSHDAEDTLALVPDYTSDLNAMHEAEKTMTEKQCFLFQVELSKAMFGDKGEETPETIAGRWLTHATAAQRAVAVLRTLGKWTNL